MGRVYKALAKNWKEQSNQTQRQEIAKLPAPKAEEAAPLRREALREEPGNDLRDDLVYGLGLAQPESAADANDLSLPVNFSVEDEIPILRDEAIHRESRVNDWSYEPRRLQVAPRPSPPPVFSEPQATLSIDSLNLEAHLVALNGSDVLAAERYRTLAVRLLNLASRQGKKMKTFLITSAKEGEGKTTVATNLAWVMAKPNERRVLLIDANLQHSSVSHKLNLDPQYGWLDVIEGHKKFAEAAIRLDPNGLYILSARKLMNGAAPADQLTSLRLEKLFTELEPHFDFILIDAPPILDSADAQRMASIMDGTVMVSRAGHTPHTQVTDALKLVPKERRLGIVLNEAKITEEVTGRKPQKAGIK
jgi:protein-tyrosine kinase